MAITFGFYNSLNNDRKYDAKQFSSIFDGIINNGIFRSLGSYLNVTAADPAAMQVKVGSGRAWFNKTWTLNDAVLPLSIEASDVVLNRIDTVVLEIDERVGVRANSIKVIKGTAATTPVAPTLINNTEQHQYPLATVYVAKGVTSIVQGNITSLIGTASTPFVSIVTSIDDIGTREYTNNFYVVDYQSITASINALDTALAIEKAALLVSIGLKANATDVYTKQEALNLLGAKANQSTTYTKLEVDALLGGIPSITGAISNVVSNNLTVSRVLISDTSGKIAASTLTTEKLGYLSDVTSNLQAQLNGKLASGATAVNSSKVGGRTIFHSATEPVGAVDGDIWLKPAA